MIYCSDDLVLTPKGVRFQNQLFPCSIGKGGISANKREGDGATPVGIHQIVGMYYRPDKMIAPTEWATPIGPSDLWSDDENDAAYNSYVRSPYQHSHERLRRPDPLYDLILVTDWNWPVAQKGAGSAIFIHQWRRPHYPTEGCIAFSRNHLIRIAKRLSKQSRLVIPAHMPFGQK